MQGSQEPQMGDINCGEEIGKLPFWTRVVYFSLGASWLMSLFGMSGLLGSNEAIVFREYRLWTLITANLFVDWLFLLFIVIYNFHTFLPALVHSLLSLVNKTLIASPPLKIPAKRAHNTNPDCDNPIVGVLDRSDFSNIQYDLRGLVQYGV